MAEVLPFPLARRRSFVWKQASYMAELRPTKAAEHLERQIDVQRRSMLARGVEAAVVERECAAGASAVQAALCQLMAGIVA